MMSVVKKGVALITGSARGIGRGIALRLAKDGFDIALNDLTSKIDQLHAVASDIERAGGKTLIIPGDVSIEEDVKRIVRDASKELEGLDVMVANAGIPFIKSLATSEWFSKSAETYLERLRDEASADDWDRVMAINARGPFLCYKYAAQQMIQQGRGGRIIGASSISGKKGIMALGAYSASKFAVRGLTHTAALELGRHGITVNCYAPGPIETPISTALNDIPESDLGLFEELRDLIGTRAQVIKRLGQPEDIASLVSYLASKEAHFITGQTFTVDGGIDPD